MDTIDAIYQRRAIKHYDQTHRMSEDDIITLFEAVIQSPTSFNMQNWRFVVVTDTALRKELRAASYDQAQVEEASILVILTADLTAWQQDPQRYWKNAPKEIAELLSGWMVPFYEGKDQLQRDEAMRSIGIAAQTLMLAAKATGFDSCPMIGFEPDKVAALIQLPKDHVVGMMVAVGQATKPSWPKPGQLPLDDVLIRDRFGT
jgi:nitroreductase